MNQMHKMCYPVLFGFLSVSDCCVKIHYEMTKNALGSYISMSIVQPTTVRPYPSSVPPGVKDVFVWLTEIETPAPSDFCF